MRYENIKPIISKFNFFREIKNNYSPGDGDFKAISSPDNSVLRFFVSHAEHFSGVDLDDGVTGLKTSSLSRAAPIDLQQTHKQLALEHSAPGENKKSYFFHVLEIFGLTLCQRQVKFENQSAS